MIIDTTTDLYRDIHAAITAALRPLYSTAAVAAVHADIPAAAAAAVAQRAVEEAERRGYTLGFVRAIDEEQEDAVEAMMTRARRDGRAEGYRMAHDEMEDPCA